MQAIQKSKQDTEANWRWLIDYTRQKKGAEIENNFLQFTNDIGGKLRASVLGLQWEIGTGLCELRLEEWRPPFRSAAPWFSGRSLAIAVEHHVLAEMPSYRAFLLFCKKQRYTCRVSGDENDPYPDENIGPTIIYAGLRVSFR